MQIKRDGVAIVARPRATADLGDEWLSGLSTVTPVVNAGGVLDGLVSVAEDSVEAALYALSASVGVTDPVERGLVEAAVAAVRAVVDYRASKSAPAPVGLEDALGALADRLEAKPGYLGTAIVDRLRSGDMTTMVLP